MPWRIDRFERGASPLVLLAVLNARGMVHSGSDTPIMYTPLNDKPFLRPKKTGEIWGIDTWPRIKKGVYASYELPGRAESSKRRKYITHEFPLFKLDNCIANNIYVILRTAYYDTKSRVVRIIQKR